MATTLETVVAKLVGIQYTGRMLRAQVDGVVMFLGELEKAEPSVDYDKIAEQLLLIAAVIGDQSTLTRELRNANVRFSERNSPSPTARS